MIYVLFTPCDIVYFSTRNPKNKILRKADRQFKGPAKVVIIHRKGYRIKYGTTTLTVLPENIRKKERCSFPRIQFLDDSTPVASKAENNRNVVVVVTPRKERIVKPDLMLKDSMEYQNDIEIVPFWQKNKSMLQKNL